MAAAWHGSVSGNPPLSFLPKAERDSVLVGIVQHALRTYYPGSYRSAVCPAIWQCDFRKEESLYGLSPHYPANIQGSDTCYHVMLYYPRWKEEGFAVPYTATAVIRDKGRELCRLRAQEARNSPDMTQWMLHCPTAVGGSPDLRRECHARMEAMAGAASAVYATPTPLSSEAEEGLCALPATVRDDSLKTIAVRRLTEERRGFISRNDSDMVYLVEAGDFALLRQQGLPEWLEEKGVPSGVRPCDTCYRVVVLNKALKEKGDTPYMATVKVVGRTGQVYGVEWESGVIAWF